MRIMALPQDDIATEDATSDYLSRPKLAHVDTDRILSYYENHAAAGSSDFEAETLHGRSRSSTASSGSEYSLDDVDSSSSSEEEETSNGRRRPSVPSDGRADRRRIAIVETENKRDDSGDETSSTGTRRAIRKQLSRLALVAPPDASPNSYTNIASAPAHTTNIPVIDVPEPKHTRSASEATRTLRSERSRDVGDKKHHGRSHSNVPKSYFESKELAPEASKSGMMNGLITPEIGQAKDIRQPVVGPVVVDAAGAWNSYGAPSASTLSPFSPANPYLHYQPGIHSTAGPPPPPIPRYGDPSAPPPRPPRMHTPNRSTDSENLRIPTPTSVLSVSRSTSGKSQPAVETPMSDSPVTLRPSRSMHIREGAHPPSTTTEQMSPQTSPQPLTMNEPVIPPLPETPPSPITEGDSCVLVDVPSISGHSPDEKQPALEVRRETSWVNLKVSANTSVMDNDGGPPPSPTTASNPAKSALSNWKRFSALPRTPSLISMSLLASGAKQSRTPSPSLPPVPSTPVRRKVISPWPDAMRFKDVLVHRSASDRATGYANKINELAMYDCGLSDWVFAVKHRGIARKPTSTRSRPTSVNQSYHATPTMMELGQQPRHVSNGSNGSGGTFPRRRDAYAATDLSPRPEDIPTAAPPLPYPSLAQGARNVARMSVLASSPSTTTRSLPIGQKAGGFFSSIARKNSTSKKDRLIPNSTSPNKLLAKRGSPPRPVPLPSAPIVPGGPRAPPGRAQSVAAVARRPSVDEMAKTAQKQRNSMIRRPSLFPTAKIMGEPAQVSSIRNSAEFNDQLEKLSILLPHAEKTVLAGYLRRCGQDILAVGRYLEDEKNGAIIQS